MKTITIFAACLLFMSSAHAIEDPVFSGPILLRGVVDKNIFSGSTFSIGWNEGGFAISCNQSKQFFPFITSAKVLSDAVVSKDFKAAAISLRVSNKWGDPQLILATIDEMGQSKIYEYKERNLAKNLGWIEELGAVSNNAKFILAKYAAFLPEKNGIRVVNHHWAIFAIDNNSLELLEVGELDVLFQKWVEYTSVKSSSINNPSEK